MSLLSKLSDYFASSDIKSVIYRLREGPLDTAVIPSDGSSTTTVDSDMHPSDSDVATSNQASSISAFSLDEDHSVSIIHSDESGSSTNLGSQPDFSQYSEESLLLCEMFATNPEEDIKGFTALV
ncbi:hypothetical protein QCA50_014768 [Cerrena zonata]|uniref:Uncharacterized protein n=1 Tax=Cerrena zonata TaxID=2478898 RepID=A0AAW0FMT6_9APHY